MAGSPHRPTHGYEGVDRPTREAHLANALVRTANAPHTHRAVRRTREHSIAVGEEGVDGASVAAERHAARLGLKLEEPVRRIPHAHTVVVGGRPDLEPEHEHAPHSTRVPRVSLNELAIKRPHVEPAVGAARADEAAATRRGQRQA